MSDLLYLSNVINSIDLIGQYMKSRRIGDLKNSTLLRDAVCKRIEEIGENLRKISTRTKKKYPEIDWIAFIEARNFLTHVYQLVNVQKLWRIVKYDIPKLRKELKTIIDKEKNA